MRTIQQYDMPHKEIRWGLPQRIRARFDGSYRQYMDIQMIGIKDYAATMIDGDYGKKKTAQTKATESAPAAAAATAQKPYTITMEDVYRSLISHLGRVSDDQRSQTEKLMDTMRYMNQDSQAGETSRHDKMVSELTKSLYSIQQENTKVQSTLISEIAGFRKDYADIQTSYQHMLKETGNQIDKIIKAYEQQREKDVLFLRETIADYKKADEKRMEYLMEDRQRDRNLLTDTIEKIIGYQPKPVTAKKKTSTRKGGKRAGIGKVSEQLEKLIKIDEKILENLDEQTKLEKQKKD